MDFGTIKNLFGKDENDNKDRIVERMLQISSKVPTIVSEFPYNFLTNKTNSPFIIPASHLNQHQKTS